MLFSGLPNPVFYFSGTGACLSAARRICAEMPGFAPVPIAALAEEKQIEIDADAVGFVFPLYYGGLPRIVEDFVKSLRFTRTCYAFAAVACGRPRGCALYRLDHLLRRRGSGLSAGFYMNTVSNYLPYNDLNSLDDISARRQKGDRRLGEIIALLKRGEKAVEKDGALWLRALHPLLIGASKRYDRLFVSDEKCNSCGTCRKVCPVNNIVLKDGKPVWKHSCQFCLACIHYCPRRAIQWNGITQGRGRYHCEGVSVADIAGQKSFQIREE